MKTDDEGCSGICKSYLDKNVQEANGLVDLCDDDGINVSLREGFGLSTGCCILSALNYVLI